MVRLAGVLGLLFGVEVVEVAEKLIKAMIGGQELVAVAQVILAEPTGDVPQRLEQLGDGGVFGLQPRGAPGRPTLVSPVQAGFWPVMKAARPALQLCWP
jgi:hypothetical protein